MIGHSIRHRSPDEAGTDGVHSDVELGQLLGGRSSEPDDAGLRCRVVGLPGVANLT